MQKKEKKQNRALRFPFFAKNAHNSVQNICTFHSSTMYALNDLIFFSTRFSFWLECYINTIITYSRVIMDYIQRTTNDTRLISVLFCSNLFSISCSQNTMMIRVNSKIYDSYCIERKKKMNAIILIEQIIDNL